MSNLYTSFQDAAEEFQRESGLNDSTIDMMSSLKQRTAIRESIQEGNIQQAIVLVNDLDPEVIILELFIIAIII